LPDPVFGKEELQVVNCNAGVCAQVLGPLRGVWVRSWAMFFASFSGKRITLNDFTCKALSYNRLMNSRQPIVVLWAYSKVY
jgi:hypothetical protein